MRARMQQAESEQPIKGLDCDGDRTNTHNHALLKPERRGRRGNFRDHRLHFAQTFNAGTKTSIPFIKLYILQLSFNPEASLLFLGYRIQKPKQPHSSTRV